MLGTPILLLYDSRDSFPTVSNKGASRHAELSTIEAYVERYEDDIVQDLKDILSDMGYDIMIMAGTKKLARFIGDDAEPFPYRGVVNMGTGAIGAYRAGQAATFLEMVGVPYTGSNPQTLLCLRDKTMTKVIAAHAGIDTAPGIFVTPGSTHLIDSLSDSLYPVFAKPNFGSCGVGIEDNFAPDRQTAKELADKLLTLAPEGVLIEKFIAGQEITVYAIGNGQSTVIIPLVLLQDNGDRLPETFVYSGSRKMDQAKLGGYRWYLARDHLDANIIRSVEDAARTLATALNTRDFSRFDFRLTADERLYFIEANGQPGLKSFAGSMTDCVNSLWFRDAVGVQKLFLTSAFERMGLLTTET